MYSVLVNCGRWSQLYYGETLESKARQRAMELSQSEEFNLESYIYKLIDGQYHLFEVYRNGVDTIEYAQNFKPE